VAQTLQRLAHRPAADPERLGDRDLVHAVAGLDLAGENLTLDLLLDLAGERFDLTGMKRLGVQQSHCAVLFDGVAPTCSIPWRSVDTVIVDKSTI
jgi:hypothetical protein